MTTLYITGFGKFANVETNPSMIIVEALRSCGTPLAAEACLKECFEVIHVSKTGIDEYFEQTHVASDHISIHFGVNSFAKSFLIEKNAYNQLDFSIPDMCGFAPRAQCIDENYVLDRPKQTDFDIDGIVKALQEEDGFSVSVSEDPGRYCCNYIYYQALVRQSSLGQPKRSVFVHVPPFSVIDRETQIAFAKRVISRLCSKESLKNLTSGGSRDGGAKFCNIFCGAGI
jgi:pyroglutamyl-peptidase